VCVAQSMSPGMTACPVRVDALDDEIRSKDQECSKNIIMVNHLLAAWRTVASIT
jgi:hypothetical protein